MSNITERKNFKVVIAAGFILAMNGGYISALSLAGLHSTTVAHVTGDVAKTGIYSLQGEWFQCARIGLVWLAFILGSSLSATIVSAGTISIFRDRRCPVHINIHYLFRRKIKLKLQHDKRKLSD
jgi:uncharacterized membrane protein YoaK (UPF0700 family)